MTIRIGMAFCFLAILEAIIVIFARPAFPGFAVPLFNSILMLMALIGTQSFRAHKLLRDRVLEKEVMELRKAVSAKG